MKPDAQVLLSRARLRLPMDSGNERRNEGSRCRFPSPDRWRRFDQSEFLDGISDFSAQETFFTFPRRYLKSFGREI